MPTTIQVVEKLLERSPMAIAQLYQKHGIDEQPNVQTTLDCVDAFGDPFLMELFELYYAESQFLGIHSGKKKPKAGAAPAEAKQEEKKEKSNLWDKFKGIFTKGKKVAGEASDTAGQVQDTAESVKDTAHHTQEVFTDKPTSAKPTTKAEKDKEEEKKKKDEEIMGLSPAMFYGSLITLFLFVCLILFLYFNNNKK